MKKIKDLTREEMNKMCSFHLRKGIGCLNENTQNCKCPLWYANQCLAGFVLKLQHLEKEVEIDESDND